LSSQPKRKSLVRALALAASLWTACDPDADAGKCIDDSGPTGTDVRVFPAERCGLDFSVSIPDACQGGGCGLVLDLHGFGMDASIQDRNTALRRIGRANGYVVAQPTGRVGLGGLPAFDLSGADTRSLRNFVLEAVAALKLDPKRVHVEGFSEGGALAMDLACRNPELIASAAVVSSGDLRCATRGLPAPLLHVHGSRDTLIELATAHALRESIVEAMGASVDAGTRVPQSDTLQRTRFENDRGEVYEFVEHSLGGASVGDGHCFPGSFETTLDGAGPGVSTLAFGCAEPSAPPIGVLVMQFFLSHPKP